MQTLREFYRGKHVFVTGHTGFKGAWLTQTLLLLGADVTGYALGVPTQPSLFQLLRLENEMRSITGDVRDYERLKASMERVRPEIVLHLAAQPIVLEGYRDPRGTYETNVMGTVNLLECIRHCDTVRSVVNVTTDKVYRGGGGRPCREGDTLDGQDPYSNSKSCSELVTGCYANHFIKPPVSAARAGNAIGGGDFAPDRIIPDCVRAAVEHRPLVLRHPDAVRPYQHVLEPLSAYLLLAMRQTKTPALAGAYNIGPEEGDCVRTEELVRMFREAFGAPDCVTVRNAHAPRETEYLALDSAKARDALGWRPALSIDRAIALTAGWTRAWIGGENVVAVTKGQIEGYLAARPF